MKLAAACIVLVALPLAAQQPSVEPVLVELRLGRLASRTVSAHRSGDNALLPVLQLFDLAEVLTRRERDGDLIVVLQPGNRRVTISPHRRTLAVDGRTRQLDSTEFLVQDQELYVSNAVLTETLGIRFELSWDDLEVTVPDPDDLPVGRRYRRAALAAALLRPVDAIRADGSLNEPHRPIEGVIADYGLLVPTDPGPKAGAYNLTLGFTVLQGAFIAGVQNEGPIDDGNARLDLSWTGVWRNSKWLAQLRLGDGFSSGPRTRALRGVSFGNVPFRRPTILGQLPYTQTLGPGWEIEAYRGGRLISFDSVNALGQFSLDVPIQYGENPVDFIAYGPFGEVRQYNRTYRVSADVIPAGRFEYAVSGGACRGEAPCSATGNVDLRLGLTPRITAFAGYDRFWRDTLADLSHPYAGIVAGLTNAVVVEGEAIGSALVRGQLRIEPSTNFLFAAEAVRFDQAPVEPILTIQGRRRQFTLVGQARPFAGRLRNWLVLDAGVDRIFSDDETLTTARLGGSFQPGQVRLIPSLRWGRAQPRSGAASTLTTYGLTSIILPLRELGSFAGMITTRAGVEFETPARLRSASAFFSRPVSRFVRLELGGSWLTGQRASLTAFLAADLPQARAYTTVERNPTGDVVASQFLQGSVLYDAGWQRLVLNAGPSAHQGGVSGRVFLDENQNGRYDDAESVLPEVEVTVGLYSQRTDRHGEFRIWPIPAYDPIVAALDTTSLASPLWLPAFSGIELTPGPNRFTTLNIPVLSGGVIEGRVVVVSGTGEVPLPGADLILQHRVTGQQRRITTFRDGSFYALSIRPGVWDVTADPALLARLGRKAEPLQFSIPQMVEGTTISGLVLRIY